MRTAPDNLWKRTVWIAPRLRYPLTVRDKIWVPTEPRPRRKEASAGEMNLRHSSRSEMP